MRSLFAIDDEILILVSLLSILVPQAKEPREAKHKHKRTGKQPVVDLDEDDEDDEMASRRSITRWNNTEEILLAESWIEHSQDANIGKDQHEDIYWNLIMSDFKSRTTAPPCTGGSQSESVSSLVSQYYRRKCDAAEKAYEAKREKELAIMQCKELEFLMIDPSSLPPAKRAIIEKKQAEIMRKYLDA
uniref:No apical meristem-associated C-terminal domain-containing protein n=1 Tax=Tanacetum cinerariifolium TaxID=118510 RepID=A0A6L2JWC5_TANCI|nr:hypothetical protein [Tanacetum cinerariifolium]